MQPLRGNLAPLTLASGKPFAPSDLANLALWLKADAITGLSDGTAVAAWSDSSGAGRDMAQATPAAKPLYKTAIQNNLPIVRFDGADDFMALSSGLNLLRNLAGATIIAVTRSSNNAQAQPVFFVSTAINTTSTRAILRTAAISANGWEAAGRRLDADALQTLTNATSAANFGIASVTFDYASSNLYLRVNGGTPATKLDFQTDGNTSDTDSASIQIGLVGVQILKGDIAEVIVYQSALSDTDRGKVETYLSSKWAITLA